MNKWMIWGENPPFFRKHPYSNWAYLAGSYPLFCFFTEVCEKDLGGWMIHDAWNDFGS